MTTKLKASLMIGALLFSAGCSTEDMLGMMGYTWYCSAKGEDGVTYRASGDTKQKASSRLSSKCSHTNCWEWNCQPR